MKKFIYVFLTILTISLSFSLIGCDKKTEEQEHVHSYNVSVTREPSCITVGEKTFVCGCGNNFTEEIKALGHVYKSVVINPTCTKEGYTTHTCERCKDSYTDTKVDLLAHTPSNAVRENEIAATCSILGKYDSVIYCSVCETEISRETKTIDKLAHNYSEELISDDTHHWHECECKEADEKVAHKVEIDEAVSATCVATGLTEGSHCSVCDKVLVAQKEVEKAPHTYSKDFSFDEENHWYAATCEHTTEKKDVIEHTFENESYEAVGKTLYAISKCVCGYSEKRLVNKEDANLASNEIDLIYLLSHGYSVKLTNDIDITTSEIKIKGVELTLDMNGKSITNSYSSENPRGGILYICDGAIVTITGNGSFYSANGTQFDYVITTENNATVNIENGYFYSYGSTNIYAKLNSVVNIYGGRYESAQELEEKSYVLDVLEVGSSESWGKINVYAGEFVNYNPADSSNDSDYTNKLASNELHSLYEEASNTYIVSKHNLIHFDAKVATCEDSGWKAYEKCENCSYTTYETISALNHDYETVIIDPTCTEKGYTKYTCKNDPTHTYVDSYVDETGHTETTTLAKEPTCFETGLTEGKHCSICSTVLVAQEVIQTIEHSWDEGMVTKEPIVKETGILTYTCEVCSATKTDDIPTIPPRDFTVTFVNWDDEVLLTLPVKEASDAVYTGPTPTKPSTSTDKKYEFMGWDQDLTDISDNLVVKALFVEVDLRQPLKTDIDTMSYDEIFALIPNAGDKTDNLDTNKKANFIGYLIEKIISEDSIIIVLEDEDGNIIKSVNTVYLYNTDVKIINYPYLLEENDVLVVNGYYRNVNGEIQVSNTWIRQIGTEETNTLPEYVVNNVSKNLKLNEIYSNDFELTTSKNDCSISWVSEHSGIVINGGTAKVTRAIDDVSGQLIATITKGELKVTKEFTVTVKKAETGIIKYDHTLIADNLKNSAATGTSNVTMSNQKWSFTPVWASDTLYKNNSTKGVQIGKEGAPATSLTFETQFSYAISEVRVNASVANGGKTNVAVYVNGELVGTAQELSSTATEYSFKLDNTVENATVKIVFTQPTSSKAIYFKQITIVQ